METLNLESRGLCKLKDLKNYKIIKPDYDVRGWNVLSSDKKSIGIIDEIIIDPELKKALYLDIYLHSDIKINSKSRHLFAPINMIKFDLKTESVILINIKTVTSLRKTETGNESVKIEGQKNQNEIANPGDLESINDDDFYDNEFFDESNLYKSKEKKLFKLKELITADTLVNIPDVRDWIVITSDYINIGKVDELLIDKDLNKIRYLDVKIYEGPIFNVERHILIPVGLAELGVNNDNKILIKIDSNEFINYPAYNGETISDYEKSLFNLFKNENDAEYTEDQTSDKKLNYNIEKLFQKKKT